jgi:hypothetical protein
MSHTFWLGELPDRDDRRMRQIAECISEIRPAIERASRIYGDRRTMWALLATLVHTALDRGDGPLVAAMLRTNALILEAEAGTTLLGIEP